MKYTMSDGRVFTSYLPNCDLNSVLQKQYGTKDVHAYRYFLQQNADKVMKDTRIGTDECKFCPVCEASLSYRPNGDILAQQSKQ
jgi:hypothetical protein